MIKKREFINENDLVDSEYMIIFFGIFFSRTTMLRIYIYVLS